MPDVLRRLAHLPGLVCFDSATPGGVLGRHSFVAVDPFANVRIAAADVAYGTDGLRQLAELMAPLSGEASGVQTVPDLPPFQGGAAGVLSYELGRSLERLPSPRWDEFQLPAMVMGIYDRVLAWDHVKGKCWIISQGLPETDRQSRRERAVWRLRELLEILEVDVPQSSVDVARGNEQHKTVSREQLAPQFAVEERQQVTSDFSREVYLSAVARAVEYIHAGDVFQVNLSQRLLRSVSESPLDTYLRLRKRNAAPFAGYCDLGGAQVMSSSPERFISVKATGQVETRPIKGTRQRSDDPAVDRQLAEELLAHPKDRAENVMIVDLLRNDLSQVCEDQSVKVPTLCGLESYKHVHHLVSVVQGKLAGAKTPIDLLRAAFPGGSITGAPKVRAMEIIAELEPTARGPYCGSMAYIGFDGAMDSNILIRTLVSAGGWLQGSVGGGIVADSDPAAEYEETWHKAAGLI